MKNVLAVVVILGSCLPGAAASLSVQGRLERAGEASSAAAGSASPEQSSALSLRALEGGAVAVMTAVDARGAGRKDAAAPALTVAPAKRSEASVPAPAAASARGSGGDHAGFLMLSGLAAPAVGAIIGAVVGGAPGAIAGALIGLCVGFVLAAVGAARWLRGIFNP